MSENNSVNGSMLDNARAEGGSKKMGTVFAGIARQNRNEAIALITGEGLSFSSFYMLMPQIREAGLLQQLRQKHKLAINIINRLLNSPESSLDLSVKKQGIHEALLWMVKTGVDEVDEEEYRRVMDLSASVLLRTYNDRSVLPYMSQLIFGRKKKGQNIHNLCWAFFGSEDVQALKLIAERLDSEDPDDVILARKMLKPNEMNGDEYLSWLEDNKDNLEFSGVGMQCSHEPVIFRIKTKGGWDND